MTFYLPILISVLVLNAMWFGAGFNYFSLNSSAAAKLLVPKPERSSPLFTTLSVSGRFLGGMNFAFAGFAVMLLLNRALFSLPEQWALFTGVFALAHGSQFAFNVPVALQGMRTGRPQWPVLSGPMLFIFTLDCVLMVANAGLAVALFAA